MLGLLVTAEHTLHSKGGNATPSQITVEPVDAINNGYFSCP